MANNSTLSDTPKYEVCVVQMGNSPEEATEMLKLAFEAMETNQLEPLWITMSDCLKITKKEPKLYVLDPFEGVAFEHLKTFNCRIVGPLCILYCLQYSDVLPKRSYPVYSVSMRKITVSCSNISTEMRDEISSRVQLMGGFFSKDLTKSVTHLVVGEVGSQKYKVAANFRLPIMVSEWITDVWENGQYKQLHASDSCYNKYKCPVFKGLVITVSQLSAEERLAIKTVIEENGGSYSGALKARETTHLILNECTGDKYRFAKNWKVICVKVNWIYDSVEVGYCKDETFYLLDESVQTQQKRSTPKKDLTSIELPLVDCSVIVGHPAVSHLDETMKSDVSISIPRKNNSYLALDEFNLSSVPKYGQFLDGCKIFLAGFNAFHMDKLRKIVNSGGGMRFSKYSDSISHVVCNELSDDIFQSIKSSSIKPYVVNFKWLLECCKNEKLVDEKPFLFIDVNTLSPEKNEVLEEKVEIPKQKLQNSFHVSAKDEYTTDNITDILKQYINEHEENNKENKINKCDKGNESPKLVADVKNISNNFELLPKIDDSGNKVQPVERKASSSHLQENSSEKQQVTVENIDEPENEDEVTSLFSGFKFVIIGFGEKDFEILASMIETHSGSILNKPSNLCDIAVVPLIWHDFQIPVPNIVSNCWLQKCIEESRIFDFDENELFRPIALTSDKKPFESFVISFSQYAGTERDCLIHLAENLGAICQEYFVRKANAAKGVLSNTHLVVSTPDGSKYEASKKWKIPAVNKKWVIDAAKVGVAPDVKGYLVDEFPELPFDDNLPKVPMNSKKKSMSNKNLGNKDVFASPNSNFSELSNDDKKNISSSFKTVKKSIGEISTIEDERDLNSKYCVPKGLDQYNQDGKLSDDDENEKLPLKSTKKSIDDIKNSKSEKDINLKNGINTPLQHNRVAELCNQSRKENKSPSAKQSIDSSNGSFSFNQTPNFKFQISGILNDLDASVSRESFGGSKNDSRSLEEMFSRNLVCAVQRLDDKYDITECPNENNITEKKKSESDKPCPLKGVVMYVSKKLSNLQVELNEIIVSLGGDYLWTYSDSCTHFIFVGKPNDITKEFREARAKGKKIVSPEWIYACKENEACVNEDLYPHTFKANMTLSQQIIIQKTIKNVPKEDKPENDKPDVFQSKTSTDVKSIEKKTPKSAEVDFNKQLNELLVAAKSAKRRHSRRVANSVSSSPINDISPIQKHPRHFSDVGTKPAKIYDNVAEDMPDTCSQHSQSYPITWDDPTGRLEREKIAARAAKNTEKLKKEKSSSIISLPTEKNPEPEVIELDLKTPTKIEKVCVQIKKFMFTNISENSKTEYIEKIQKLGGEVSDEKTFDISATHLILLNPIKNEKFLSSVASGKWVLHPEYLTASVLQNKFASEEEYEWGGPSTEEFIQNLPKSSVKIAKCPYRWRSKVQGCASTGAFDSWKVVVHADDQAKLATYTKILESGGAEIIPASSAKSNLDRITHVFVDKKRGSSKTELSCYFTHNIKCLKPEYLAFFLIEDPPPNIENFLISEANEHNTDSSTSSRRRTISSASSRQSKRTRLK